MPGRNVEIDPTATTRRADTRPDFPSGPIGKDSQGAQLGASVRWGVTPNVTVNATAQSRLLAGRGRRGAARRQRAQFLYSYKLNPQTVLFLGYSDNRLGQESIALTQTDRTFFLKIGYAWLM